MQETDVPDVINKPAEQKQSSWKKVEDSTAEYG